MNRELIQILEQMAREKGLPVKVIVEAVVTAIELAARKRDKAKFDVEYEESTGTLHLYAIKHVVETVSNPKLEIAVAEARNVNPRAMPGDDIYLERDISDLGRISAQKAKQIINQKVKEAEKHKVYELYQDRVGDVVLGTVQRIENGVIVNLNEAEAILPKREQIPGEFYRRGDQLRAYISEVKPSTSGKWPQIILSRTCDDFLFRLFEIEVPEFSEGIVQIVGVARDPGGRAKICVQSVDANVDPVGACVGMRGARIQSIVRELRGEKIDIIEWNEDPAVLVSRAITPAKVQGCIVDYDEHEIEVIVADDQLALAIGKRGQNAKLAVRLTGWKINITSESERKLAVQESFDKAFTQESDKEDSEESDEYDSDDEEAFEQEDEDYDSPDEGEFEDEDDDDDLPDDDEFEDEDESALDERGEQNEEYPDKSEVVIDE